MHFLALYDSTGNVHCGGEFTAFAGADLLPGSNGEQARLNGVNAPRLACPPLPPGHSVEVPIAQPLHFRRCHCLFAALPCVCGRL